MHYLPVPLSLVDLCVIIVSVIFVYHLQGGFPYWLFTKYPGISLRTYDLGTVSDAMLYSFHILFLTNTYLSIDYLAEVRKWYGILMPKMEKYLYANGGPIIMVQVENEYGSFSACDRQYSSWLKVETNKYVGDKAVLFTNDGPVQLPCGIIQDVLATLDFGAGNCE